MNYYREPFDTRGMVKFFFFVYYLRACKVRGVLGMRLGFHEDLAVLMYS